VAKLPKPPDVLVRKALVDDFLQGLLAVYDGAFRQASIDVAVYIVEYMNIHPTLPTI
jgi:hypothetical protein